MPLKVREPLGNQTLPATSWAMRSLSHVSFLGLETAKPLSSLNTAIRASDVIMKGGSRATPFYRIDSSAQILTKQSKVLSSP